MFTPKFIQEQLDFEGTMTHLFANICITFLLFHSVKFRCSDVL